MASVTCSQFNTKMCIFHLNSQSVQFSSQSHIIFNSFNILSSSTFLSFIFQFEFNALSIEFKLLSQDQLLSTTPVSGGMGMHLLQKMGWRPGEGLGKEKNGSLQPLLLEVKLDKRGLVADEEVGSNKFSHFPQHKSLTFIPLGGVFDNILDTTSSAKGATGQKESVIDSNGKTKHGEQTSGLIAWRVMCQTKIWCTIL